MFPRAHAEVKPIGFQFVALPVELLRRTDVSPAAKLLAAVVMDSARGSRSGSCKLTNAALGARIGRSAASVKRLLAELEAAGVVRRDTLAEGRVRTAVVPAWVAQDCAAGHAPVAQDCATGGAGLRNGVAQDRATIQSPPSEPRQTGPISSTLGGEEPDPKPTPAEVAAAIRAMLGGRASDVDALFRRVGYSAVAAARPRGPSPAPPRPPGSPGAPGLTSCPGGKPSAKW